jgi:DNA-binding MarR family transcriptional regulator
MARIATELEAAPRLRTVVGRLSRMLRRTDSGSAGGLTPTQVTVLLTSDRQGSIRLAELGEREGLNPTLLSRTVASLLADGLIARSADPDDRRSAWISATDAGRTVARRIRKERTAAVQIGLEALGDDDRAQLEAALPALERLTAVLAEREGR